MKILFIFDEDGKYGAPKTGMEMIGELKNIYDIEPIIITSRFNEVNEWCIRNKIENYVTYHHKCTYVDSKSFKAKLKIIPRYLRYIVGNYVSLFILRKKIDFKTIDIIHINNSGLHIGVILSNKYKIPARKLIHYDNKVQSWKAAFQNILDKKTLDR